MVESLAPHQNNQTINESGLPHRAGFDHIAGITEYPDADWMVHIARNLADEFDRSLKISHYLTDSPSFEFWDITVHESLFISAYEYSLLRASK
jgi:hypothetical protein